MENLIRKWMAMGFSDALFGKVVCLAYYYIDNNRILPEDADTEAVAVLMEQRDRLNKLLSDRKSIRKKALAKKGVTV